MWKIPLFNLDYDEREEQAVLEVIRSGWLTMGETTQRFETSFAEMCGVRHAIAVSNGTVALHLATLAAGIQPGDEVIVPALTFVATAACVRYVGAVPIFADITSPDDLTISPMDVERRITPKTRAIIVMHYAGYPCDMPAFENLAQKYQLKLIEDAAHAPGMELNGRKAGAWGDVAAFSFFSNKNLATGEGGMVTTNDDEIAARLRAWRSHGMTTLTWDRHRGQAWSYDVTDLGYNYRPSEILSALGLAQLQKLSQNNQRRYALVQTYRDLFSQEMPQFYLPFSQPRGLPTHHILPALLPSGTDRAHFMDAMKAQGIQTSIHYPPIPTFSAYRNASSGLEDFPVTKSIATRQVTLPLYPQMKLSDVKVVVDTVRDALSLT